MRWSKGNPTKRLDTRIGQLERRREPEDAGQLLRWFEGVSDEELEMAAEYDPVEAIPAHYLAIEQMTKTELTRQLKLGIDAVRFRQN